MPVFSHLVNVQECISIGILSVKTYVQVLLLISYIWWIRHATQLNIHVVLALRNICAAEPRKLKAHKPHIQHEPHM